MSDYPQTNEIREYVSFLLTCENVIKDEYKKVRNNREPSDSLVDSLLKITSAHFAKVTDRPNGNGLIKKEEVKNSNQANLAESEKYDFMLWPPFLRSFLFEERVRKIESVRDFVKSLNGKLQIKGLRIVQTGKIDNYWKTVDALKEKGFKHYPAKDLGDGKWESAYFEPEVKA